MRILGIFIAALVGILYAQKREGAGGLFFVPSTSDDSMPESAISEPTPETFTTAVEKALEVALETVKDTASSVSAAVFGTKYDDLIVSSAKLYGLDPALLYRLLMQESHFREDIISGKIRSRVGALGIAQFMPATAREELGSEAAALDPAKAIPGAARYLAKLIRQTGSIEAGVAAYNWGVGNVTRKGLAVAPSETVNYVQAITGVKIV